MGYLKNASTSVFKDDGVRELPFDSERLVSFIKSITDKFPHLSGEELTEKTLRQIQAKDSIEANKITNQLILNILELIGVDEGQHPDWSYIASQIYLKKLYKEAAKNRGYDAKEKYGNFYGLLKMLGSKGVYSPLLLRDYTKEEITELEKEIDPSKDKLLNYIGVRSLSDRYLATDHSKNVYELPQERFMVISMELMREEKNNRLQLVKEAYWALSNLFMTVATPTLANAGKSHGQLSSCFIDTVEDSLRSIYDSNTDIATLSKNGGGIGTYFGYVRALGSSIKGYKGVSGGCIPWIKGLNQTAVSVDQLGQRQGSIAVYLDVFHKDIMGFLDLRLNNGDHRLRAHDVFTGVCLPDVFMEQVEKRGDWYLFDPYEVKTKTGYYLQDYYDEEKGSGTFREKYYECVNNPELTKDVVPAIDVMKRIMVSQLETGTPYMFYRDTVNRLNPNKKYHEDGTAKASILSSNLCTEILQSQTPTVIYEEKLKDDKIIITKIPGEFVVCNLSSVTLSRAVENDILERLISIQVRMLDNVIDLNRDRLEVLQAVTSNEKYRAIGLGQSDWHHLLVNKKIKWESEEAVQYADKLYEKIAYLTIKASAELAKEKGAYPEFKNSDWCNGNYFDVRGYFSDEWQELKQQVQKTGIRNGFLLATAPTISTSLISGSTPGIDPIFKRQYEEEKKNYKTPVTAPGLSSENFFYYKNAYEINQEWSIKQNAARQRHIDQGQSFNIYVNADIKATELLNLHLQAWKSGLKTTYYVRSTSLDGFSDCESCSS